MVDVTRSTFENYYSEIEKVIRQSDFIAVDTEFTALVTDEQTKSSLFDSIEERYSKLRKIVSCIVPCQIGLSAFKHNFSTNRVDVSTFNCYLYPLSFGPSDVKFLCQASSLEFLAKYKFDFNKFIYEGIPYINEEQERQLKSHLSSGGLLDGLERDIDERVINQLCSDVAHWIVNSKEGDIHIVKKIEDSNKCNDYLIHTEIRWRFPGVWTENDAFGNISVEKVSSERRRELENGDRENELEVQKKLLKDVLGFTRIFRILTECKKPLIGHNLFMDLLLIFDKFHRPLPARYRTFKEEIHKIFPQIYDTKHITLSLRKPLEKTNLLNSTALEELYSSFSSTKGKQWVIHSPDIHHATGYNKYKSVHTPHESGYDSYQSGYVFIRIAHILTFSNIKSTEVEPCQFHKYLSNMNNFVNRINVIRATLNHIRLDGEDPRSERPELIYVKPRKFTGTLNADMLAKWFSPYGSVDVKLQGKKAALVAAGNFGCARDILRVFKRHKHIHVAKYNVFKHSPIVRTLLWTGALFSGGLCIWVLWSSRKPS